MNTVHSNYIYSITHACNKLEQQISFLIYNKSVPSQLSSSWDVETKHTTIKFIFISLLYERFKRTRMSEVIKRIKNGQRMHTVQMDKVRQGDYSKKLCSFRRNVLKYKGSKITDDDEDSHTITNATFTNTKASYFN